MGPTIYLSESRRQQQTENETQTKPYKRLFSSTVLISFKLNILSCIIIQTVWCAYCYD